MTEVQRPARTAIDALHAELLGSVVELVQTVDKLKTDIPAMASDVESAKTNITDSFAEFKSSTVALVAYIKQKQLETLGSLHDAQVGITAANQKTLAGFERWIWLIAAMCGLNALLLMSLLIVILIKA